MQQFSWSKDFHSVEIVRDEVEVFGFGVVELHKKWVLLNLNFKFDGRNQRKRSIAHSTRFSLN